MRLAIDLIVVTTMAVMVTSNDVILRSSQKCATLRTIVGTVVESSTPPGAIPWTLSCAGNIVTLRSAVSLVIQADQ